MALVWVRAPRSSRALEAVVALASRVWNWSTTTFGRVWNATIRRLLPGAEVAEPAGVQSPDQRFAAAVGQLGHDVATVRLAGVSAMARVADDWPEERQLCVNALCSYLRREARPDSGFGESDVRNEIVGVISAHLRDQAEVSWASLDFDLSGAVLNDADFADTTFSGARTCFSGATFSGGVTRFARATFSGEVTLFDGATFSGGVARFDGATFCGKYAFFAGTTFSGWHTIFDGATFSGRCALFDAATFGGWYTNFDMATFAGQYTGFDQVTFSAGVTRFDGATFFGGVTRFDGAKFCGKATDFREATFAAKHTSFQKATFSGGTTGDQAMIRSSFVGNTVSWGPISPRPTPSSVSGPSKT
ncbi:MAG: hypothetical protein ABI934_01080 [Actinomycetota bacterium]